MDVTFILTEECSLRCAYCYQKNYPVTVLPVPTAVAALDSAARHGARFLALTFFGGEPLLRRDNLFAILEEARALERARRLPVTAKVSTNGLALDDEAIRRARELGLFISLSHDGVREAMDGGRVLPDGRSAFDRVDAALRRLVEARIPFAVYSVITPKNVACLARSREYLWETGARILVGAIDYTADWDEDAVRTLVREYRKLGRLYRRLLKDRANVHLEPFDSRIAQWTRPGEFQRCAPGVRQVTVGPDGTLYGCVEYFYRRLHPIGNAWTWLDPEAVRAVSHERCDRPDECGECALASRCNNTCACINLRATGRVNVPPASLCLTEQETIFEADRLAAKLYRRRVPEFLMRQYSRSYHLLSSIERLLESMGVPHEAAETRPRSL